MKLKIYLRMLLAAVAALFVATACSDSDDDPGKGGPDKPTEPLTFKINVTDIEKDQAKLSVTPSDPTAIYYYNAVKKSIYDGLGSDKAFLDDDLAFLQSEAAKQQMTLSAYLQAKSGRGTATYTLTGLEKTTEYYAYVYGIKLDGTVTSDLVKDLFTSGEGKGEDPGPGPGGEGPKFRTFAASAGDRDGKNTESCITVQIATETRITAGKMYINTSAVVNSALGEGYTYETLIKEFGTAMDAQSISIINQCVDEPKYVLASTFQNLEAGDWTVICMVSDDNGDTTEHTSVKLGSSGGGGGSGSGEGVGGDDNFKIEVANIGAMGADVTFTPAQSITTYFCDIQYTAALKGKTDTQIITELLGVYESFSEYLSTGSFMYSREKLEAAKALTPQSEYTALAFGCVNGTTATTAIAKKEFTTASESVSDEPTEAYKAWLGTWTVTSTSSKFSKKPLSFDVTFTQKAVNKTYVAEGWTASMYRDNPEDAAKFSPEVELQGDKIMFHNGQVILRGDLGAPYGTAALTYCMDFVLGGGNYYSDQDAYSDGEKLYALAGTLNSDKSSATVIGATLSFKEGDTTVDWMDCRFLLDTPYDDTDNLSVKAGAGFAYEIVEGGETYTVTDAPIGPFTMVKKKGASAPRKRALISDDRMFASNVRNTLDPVYKDNSCKLNAVAEFGSMSSMLRNNATMFGTAESFHTVNCDIQVTRAFVGTMRPVRNM